MGQPHRSNAANPFAQAGPACLPRASQCVAAADRAHNYPNILTDLWLRSSSRDTRIVSTWFRDERSKITRANAERQRVERATLGPVRNTRTGIATRFKNELEIEEDEEEDEKAPFDRHNPKQLLTRPSPRPRYAPYDVPHSSFNVDHVKKPSQRHFDPLIRASVPIDLIQPAHPSQLSISMDNESYGYPSPAGMYAYASRQPHPPLSASLSLSIRPLPSPSFDHRTNTNLLHSLSAAIASGPFDLLE